MLRLLPNWPTVLRRAWSIRLIIVAGLLSGCELVLPLYQDVLPRGTFAAASMIVTVTAFVARLVVQRDAK